MRRRSRRRPARLTSMAAVHDDPQHPGARSSKYPDRGQTRRSRPAPAEPAPQSRAAGAATLAAMRPDPTEHGPAGRRPGGGGDVRPGRLRRVGRVAPAGGRATAPRPRPPLGGSSGWGRSGVALPSRPATSCSPPPVRCASAAWGRPRLSGSGLLPRSGEPSCQYPRWSPLIGPACASGRIAAGPARARSGPWRPTARAPSSSRSRGFRRGLSPLPPPGVCPTSAPDRPRTGAPGRRYVDPGAA